MSASLPVARMQRSQTSVSPAASSVELGDARPGAHLDAPVVVPRGRPQLELVDGPVDEQMGERHAVPRQARLLAHHRDLGLVVAFAERLDDRLCGDASSDDQDAEGLGAVAVGCGRRWLHEGSLDAGLGIRYRPFTDRNVLVTNVTSDDSMVPIWPPFRIGHWDNVTRPPV